ncbi:MAG TPA: type II toxin-antitoxin system RelE/ParE family toxin [Candidatus Thermoplasmatota archaeon]|nr:type II toxin-antitoxin system RelE/ParE family toxin [Candidatus Thermoplasmatota archaeon]
MTWRLAFKPRPIAEIRKLAKSDRQRIGAALRKVQEDPFTPRSGCDTVRHRGIGQGDAFRLRVGKYRVAYVVHEWKREIIVTDVGHGHDIY